jgi:hypothetical protein
MTGTDKFTEQKQQQRQEHPFLHKNPALRIVTAIQPKIAFY